MQMQRLSDLTEKMLAGTITPAELKEWETVFMSQQDREGFVEYFSGALQQERYTARGGAVTDRAAYDRILAGILSLEKSDLNIAPEAAQPAQPAPVHRVHFLRRAFVRYAAAAVLLFAIAGVWFITRRGAEEQKQTAPIAKTEVKPGSNKAILIDANGKEILLDANASMQIGNAKIQSGVARYETATEVAFNTLRTPRGGLFEVVLPDGTHVWINAASSLKYPTAFKGAQRIVELEGEAYFEVAKDAAHPFIVQTRSDKIEVLGTHFNINAYTEEGAVKTTLAEGKVKVADVILQPGQQYSEGNITRPDMEQVLAWKNGEFRFKKMDVRMLMRQMERWYDIDVKYEGKMSGKTLSGSVSRTATAQQMVDVLNETGVVKLELKGRTIIVKAP